MCFANKDTLLGKMSRVKSRAQIEICGDCSASGWVSFHSHIICVVVYYLHITNARFKCERKTENRVKNVFDLN